VVLVEPVEEEQPEEEEDDPNFFQGKIASGYTISVLLQRWLGVSEINAMVAASKNVFDLGKDLRAGQPYSVHLEDGRFLRFEYEVNANHMLIVTREQDGETVNWQARREEIEYEIRLRMVEGEITPGSSLSEAILAAGERPTLAGTLENIFAWEINFFRVQPGDSFRLLVERRYRDGEFKGYGAMPVAEFINRNSKFEAYVFKDSFGNNSYFNASGDSLKRAFLKAPLSFTRISSRYNMRRMHPIHKTVRPHYGVDYAAPTGTPIMAIGNGEVTFRGFDKGAGNYVALKHARGYESMYLHMSRFADGLKKGSKVRQGQIIGYVGSTGYSTGPHLCFRIKHNGQFLNPEKVLSPRDESVPKNQLAAFKAERDRWRSYLQREVALSEYSREKGNL
jgi:murein DD-endopeptidase MepM/ murein hydrolase activator NlpD